jgi:hemerythrin-like domain-containing protein
MTTAAPEIRPEEVPLASIAVLAEEHRLVAKALAVLEAMISRIGGGNAIGPHSSVALTGFIRGFVEGCHQAKEEQLFFPALEAAGVDPSAIRAAVSDHARGRELVANMAQTAKLQSLIERGLFVEAAQRYIVLVRSHMAREEAGLFRLATDALRGEKDAALVRAFEQHDAALGTGAHARHLDTLNGLSHEFFNSGRH